MPITKEESRISLFGVVAALIGSLIGSVAGIWGTYARFSEDKRTQVEANRRLAYTQLKGQQAEFLLLFQEMGDAEDKNTFYQVKAAQLANRLVEHRGALLANDVKVRDEYLSGAVQQERNFERFQDQLVSSSQKMFESIGLIQLSFPMDPELQGRIYDAEAMLTRMDDVVPREPISARFLWAAPAQDAEERLSLRHKERMASMVKASEPVTNLVSYLQRLIIKDSM